MVNVAQFLSDRAAAYSRIRAAFSPGGRLVIVHQPRTERDKQAAADAMDAALATDLSVAGFAPVARRRLAGFDAPFIGHVATAL